MDGLDVNLENDKTVNEEDNNKLNFYVKSGNVQINFKGNSKSSSITANIISNTTENINIFSESNGQNNNFFKGIIYAPKAKINIGEGKNKAPFKYDGLMLGNIITLNTNNDGKDNDFIKSLVKENSFIEDDSIEVAIPIGQKETIFKKGYYK